MLRETKAVAADSVALAALQRAVQNLITAPGTRSRVDAAAARALGCAPEQLAVYRGMYALRLAREVSREFPATRALLGAARFDAQARAFVDEQPSRSYTLEHYARGFPHWLRRAGSAAAAELARLEREVASAQTACERRPRAIGAARQSAAVAPVPALLPALGARLRSFRHDVDIALRRFERGGAVRSLPHRTLQLALFRRGARVARLRVARAEAPLLRSLLHGESLDVAVARGLAAGLGTLAIRRALARWVGAKLLLTAHAHEVAARPEAATTSSA